MQGESGAFLRWSSGGILDSRRVAFYNNYKFRSGEVSSMSDSDDPESSNTVQPKNNRFGIGGIQA